MIDFENKVSNLEVQFASIKEKIVISNILYEKLEVALEKLEDLMDERKDNYKDDIREVYKKIDDTKSELSSEIKTLREEMNRNTEKLSNIFDGEKKKIIELDRWRWIVVGAAAAIGWVISKFTNLEIL